MPEDLGDLLEGDGTRGETLVAWRCGAAARRRRQERRAARSARSRPGSPCCAGSSRADAPPAALSTRLARRDEVAAPGLGAEAHASRGPPRRRSATRARRLGHVEGRRGSGLASRPERPPDGAGAGARVRPRRGRTPTPRGDPPSIERPRPALARPVEAALAQPGGLRELDLEAVEEHERVDAGVARRSRSSAGSRPRRARTPATGELEPPRAACRRSSASPSSTRAPGGPGTRCTWWSTTPRRRSRPAGGPRAAPGAAGSTPASVKGERLRRRRPRGAPTASRSSASSRPTGRCGWSRRTRSASMTKRHRGPERAARDRAHRPTAVPERTSS